MSKELLWEIKRPLLTKEMMEVGIFRFLRQFSKIQIKGERYSTDKIGESIEL